MSNRLISAVLMSLLMIFQAQLWFGRGSVPAVVRLSDQLNSQNQKNQLAELANNRLAAEVRDLKEGLDMVEEKARTELGMVKPNEIFIQIGKPSSATAQAN